MKIKRVKVGYSQGQREFSRALALLMVLQITGCDKDGRQETKPTSPPPTVQTAPAPVQAPQSAPAPAPLPPPDAKPLSSIESLVAPIALYPDPLLSEVLLASSYPLEVVQAARWLESKADPATLRGKNWDASVVRLTVVPDVITMMSNHLDWTTQLGDAFLSNPTEVMNAIQALRKRAADAGFLKDTDLQKVETKTVTQTAPESAPVEGQAQGAVVKETPTARTEEIITIAPAKADTLAVPSYNPAVVYGAPMAPPPASYAYPATGSVTNNYYPSTYATTQTTSSSDQWMTFGAGALVGGLLTWGIMEWADDDDWDDDWHGGYHVSHYYGDAVCHNGNCWHGGGNYNRNTNRNTNIDIDRGDVNIGSGNRINFDRDGTFRQDQLPALKGQGSRWQPDARHRRGQAYPPAAQQRLGRLQQPALAGGRLSGAENLPADARGFGERAATTLPAQPRISSADIQRQLAVKPAATNLAGKNGAVAQRGNAFADAKSSGQRLKSESRRGQASVNSGGQNIRRPSSQPARQQSDRALADNRRSLQQEPNRGALDTQRLQNRQNQQTQRFQTQQRREMARPNAFESAQDRGRSRDFSNRGSASRMNAASRQPRASGGGAGRGGGGRAGLRR